MPWRTLRTRCGVLGTVLVSLVGSVAAGAQQPAPTDSAPRDSIHPARPYALPPVVVTASREPISRLDIGVATSVLQGRDLAAEPTPYAARALTFLPGVSIDEASGPGGPTVLHLRGGEESFAQILFDGVPINISGGFHDLQGVTLTNVERIEVARGPLSALWGSSAMSGAVQFITRQGQPGPAQLDLLTEGGRATEHGDQTRTELTLSGGAERLRYSSGVGFAYNRGIYALANNVVTGDMSLRLDARPAERWTLMATARYIDVQAHLPVRDPGVTRVPLDPNQRDGHYRWLGSLSAGWAATPTWHHRFTARLLWDDFVYRDQKDGVTDSTSYPFFVFDFNFGFRSTLLRPGLEYVGSNALRLGKAGGSQLTVSYGAEWQREAESNNQAGDFGPSHTDFHRFNDAMFTELQGRLGPRLSVLSGARLEKFQGLAAELLPRASVVLDVVPDRLALRAATGRAFKAPNVDQQFLENPGTIPNPNLKPEHSTSWEIGATLTTPGQPLTVGVGYFNQRYDDLIRTVPADTGSKQTNKNLGSTRSTGVEVDLERWWSARWRTGANLTWLNSKILDNAGLSPTDYPVGSTLPAVPRVTGNAFVAADLTRSFTTVARATLVGEQTVFTERFTGQRVTLDPYVLLELVAHWRASSTLEVYARVNNLFDTGYETAFDRPGVPRTGVLGVRATP